MEITKAMYPADDAGFLVTTLNIKHVLSVDMVIQLNYERFLGKKRV